MASYNKAYSTDYTMQVQNVLQGLGADLGKGGVDGKWGAYTDAAYNKYKNQVDAALAGNPYAGANGMASGNLYAMPSITYKQRTLDELMAEANGLIGGAYDAQMLRQTQGYNTNQQALARSYESARKTTQDSAVARGMGRSSYLTDAVANVGAREADAVNQLTNDYNAAMAQLEASKSNAIYSYASQQQAQEQQLALNAALAQAELQYKYDALKAEQDMLEKQLAAASKNSRSSTTTTTPTPPTPPNSPDTEKNPYDTDEAAFGRLASTYALAISAGGQAYAQQLVEAGLWEDAKAAWEVLYGKTGSGKAS